MNNKVQLKESDLRNFIKKIIKEEFYRTPKGQELMAIDKTDEKIKNHFTSFTDAIRNMSELLEEVGYYNEPFLKLYRALEEFDEYYTNDFIIEEIEAFINGEEY